MTTHGDIEGLHSKVHILWHIPNYFSKQKADSYYNSPAFHFLGSTWSIRIYPNGQREFNTVEYVSLHIRQERKYKDCDINFIVSIVFADETYLERKGFASSRFNYTTWYKFIERRELLINRVFIAPRGTLTIKLVGTPSSSTDLHKGTQTKVLDGINALSRDFQALLSCEEASDVMIRVKSHVFRANKVILMARSSVFTAMFSHDMKEKITGSIDIEDCEPSSFQKFLTFIYTGKIDNLTSENVFDILCLANKYDLSDLKQICIEFVSDNLCLDMVCNVLSVADKLSLEDLKKSAKELFRKNKTSIMQTENWFSFIKENPKLATEIILEVFNK